MWFSQLTGCMRLKFTLLLNLCIIQLPPKQTNTPQKDLIYFKDCGCLQRSARLSFITRATDENPDPDQM